MHVVHPFSGILQRFALPNLKFVTFSGVIPLEGDRLLGAGVFRRNFVPFYYRSLLLPPLLLFFGVGLLIIREIGF